MIVQSVDGLVAVERMAAPQAMVAAAWRGRASLRDYDHDPTLYAAFYRTQPNVRTVVDFLARNVAQLGIHVFRRVSDTDRVRLADHDLANWLYQPTPYVTRYRLIESTMIDLGIYFNAYWLKLRQADRIGLQRLPPEEILPAGGLIPAYYRWTTSAGRVFDLPPSEVVHFSGYNPATPLLGLSPLETLKRLLDEEQAAMDHREALWNNGARIDGVIERPAGAKLWSTEQAESFRAQWRAKFAGNAGVGEVAILQEGATFKPSAFSPRQAEYATVRKLTREEVAAAYHVPLPMVGILDHATFSNIVEQHKQLYQDCLGPWLVFLGEEIERQLLIECRDQRGVYVEFNIAEKLTGSFEEQATAMRQLVGAPVMTRNEGRARLNLPAMDDPGADELVRPLNTTATAGETTPSGAAVPLPEDAAVGAAVDVAPVIEAAWKRQADALRGKPDPVAVFGLAFARWTAELTADLESHFVRAGYDGKAAQLHAFALAYTVNADTRAALTAGRAPFNREATDYAP